MLDRLGIVIADTRLKVENLSGGQRQSIAIGRAASFEPSVLIMDEPTAALAVAEVEAVLDLIRTVSARGVSVILITHRLQDLFLVCDRIQVMYEGRNVAERLIGDTNIEDIVNLIVGPQVQRPFGQACASGRSAGMSDAPRTLRTAPPRVRNSQLARRDARQRQRRLDRVVLRRRLPDLLGGDRRLPDRAQPAQHPAPVCAAVDRRGRDDLRHHHRRHRPVGRLRRWRWWRHCRRPCCRWDCHGR